MLGEQLTTSRIGPLGLSGDHGYAIRYLVGRSVGARQIVEFETSFGISAIYLAAAVRSFSFGQWFFTIAVNLGKRTVDVSGAAGYLAHRLGRCLEKTVLRSIEVTFKYMDTIPHGP